MAKSTIINHAFSGDADTVVGTLPTGFAESPAASNSWKITSGKLVQPSATNTVAVSMTGTADINETITAEYTYTSGLTPSFSIRGRVSGTGGYKVETQFSQLFCYALNGAGGTAANRSATWQANITGDVVGNATAQVGDRIRLIFTLIANGVTGGTDLGWTCYNVTQAKIVGSTFYLAENTSGCQAAGNPTVGTTQTTGTSNTGYDVLKWESGTNTIAGGLFSVVSGDSTGVTVTTPTPTGGQEAGFSYQWKGSPDNVTYTNLATTQTYKLPAPIPTPYYLACTQKDTANNQVNPQGNTVFPWLDPIKIAVIGTSITIGNAVVFTGEPPVTSWDVAARCLRGRLGPRTVTVNNQSLSGMLIDNFLPAYSGNGNVAGSRYNSTKTAFNAFNPTHIVYNITTNNAYLSAEAAASVLAKIDVRIADDQANYPNAKIFLECDAFLWDNPPLNQLLQAYFAGYKARDNGSTIRWDNQRTHILTASNRAWYVDNIHPITADGIEARGECEGGSFYDAFIAPPVALQFNGSLSGGMG